MNNGVKFGDKHSVTDWDLIMISKSIGDAEPKEKEVDIAGSNGKLDLTEWTGEVLYNNRTLTFNFDIYDSPSNWWTLKRQITNYLHGKKLRITLDQDNNYYYYGRCKVTNFSNETTVAHITIECDCEPFIYKNEITTKSITGTGTLTLSNARKRVMPKITSTSSMQFTFENKTFVVNGTLESPDIILKEGNNLIEVISGTGTLTATYQEGEL